MDRQWIKNLATSSFDPQQQRWNLADPGNPGFIAHTRVQESLDILYEKLKEAIDIFNLHATASKQLRLFKLTRGPQTKACGFMILVGNLQVKCEQVGANFHCEAIYMQRLQSITIPMRVFEAKYDHFGDVVWLMDQSIPLTMDRLCKQILEDTCRVAYETGSVKTNAP